MKSTAQKTQYAGYAAYLSSVVFGAMISNICLKLSTDAGGNVLRYVHAICHLDLVVDPLGKIESWIYWSL